MTIAKQGYSGTRLWCYEVEEARHLIKEGYELSFPGSLPTLIKDGKAIRIPINLAKLLEKEL